MTSIRYWAGVATLVMMAATPAQAQQAPAAGRIKVVSGSASRPGRFQATST